jgi:hypothetical protein
MSDSESEKCLNEIVELFKLTSNKSFTVKVSCTDTYASVRKSDDSLLNMYYDLSKEEHDLAKTDFDMCKFNKTFEEVHKVDDRGYGSWLSASVGDDVGNVSDDDSDDTKNVETNIVDPNFNKNFEEKVACGSHVDTSILHPDQMGMLSGVHLGVNINDNMSSSEVFTSMMNQHPEFTDVYSAFTHDNTIIDKVAAFDETIRPRTLEELIAERESTVDSSITPETLVAYEKKKLEEEFERQRLLREHFDPTGSERKWLTNNSFLHDFSSLPSATKNTIVGAEAGAESSQTTQNH